MLERPRVLTLCNAGGDDYPYVLLKGKWFKKCGFEPGDLIKVTNVGRGAIIITFYAKNQEYKRDPYKEKLDPIIEFSELKMREIVEFAHERLEKKGAA